MKLVICEKNIAANRIAYILSNGKLRYMKIGRTSVYEFTKDGELWDVIGLRGHIINLDYSKEYNQWTSLPPQGLIDIEPLKKVSEREIAAALKTIVDKNPFLIIATDYDREGELIGVEAIDLLKKYNKNISKIKRAKFSAITNYEITNAFTNLAEVDYNLSNAGEARQVIDLVWGVVLTRFISLTSNRLGKDFLSIGRVQSPTLAILVEREKEIQNFIPKNFWKIIANLNKKTSFDAVHINGQIWDKETAEKIFSKVKDSKNATVIDVKKKFEEETPPAPFSTTTFLQAVSYFGISAAKAMSIAEELYMAGFISYPRTDNTVYPSSINIKGILEKLKNSPFSKEAQEVLDNGRRYPTRGKKQTTDHPPIHPVGVISDKKLTSSHMKIYELICRRFLATLAKDAKSESVEALLNISNEDFKTNGYRVIEANWKSIYPYIKDKRKPLPELNKGEVISIKKMTLKEDKTKPPSRYTQGSLIAKMEQLSLGTKSTRHEIIKKLYDRKYISGSSLTPTSIAIAVVDALADCDVIKPKMTSTLEEDMSDIADGKKTINETVNESRKMLKDVMKSLEENKENIKTNIKRAHLKENKVGICPNCGKNLIIRSSRKGERFVGCTNYPSCRNAYPLPQKELIEETGKLCDACNTPIIQIRSKGNKKTEICLNPKCPKISNSNNSDLIGKCPKCGNNLIIRTSRTGDRFVGCTNFPKCKNTYSLPKNGEILPTNKICDLCKTPLIQIKTDKKEIKELCLNFDCKKIKS